MSKYLLLAVNAVSSSLLGCRQLKCSGLMIKSLIAAAIGVGGTTEGSRLDGTLAFSRARRYLKYPTHKINRGLHIIINQWKIVAGELKINWQKQIAGNFFNPTMETSITLSIANMNSVCASKKSELMHGTWLCAISLSSAQVNYCLADNRLLRTLFFTNKIQIPIHRGLTENDSRYYQLSLFRTQNDVPRCLLQYV